MGRLAPLHRVVSAWRTWRDRVAPHHMLDLSSARDTIFLAGGGRSGTTWIAEVLARTNQFRYLFEPFHPEKVPAWIGLPQQKYLRDDEPASNIEQAVREILARTFRNRWADFYNRKLIARRKLVKEIRANLMLRWLANRFPDMRMALVIRHPLAVIHSRLSLKWEPHLHTYLDQPRLMEDHLWPFESELASTASPFEAHALRWCVEHYVPLRQLSGTPEAARLPIWFYEDFCARPDESFQRLFNHIGMSIDAKNLADAVRTPSRQIRSGSAILTGENLTQSFVRHFTSAQRVRMRMLLERFGLDGLYDETGPRPNGVEIASRAVRSTARLVAAA